MDVQGPAIGPNAGMNTGTGRAVRIAFRADASVQIGTGHVMRCLTLADALRERGAECVFICRPHTGHLLDLIAQRGHKAAALPALAADTTQVRAAPAHSHWLGTDWASDAEDTRQALGAESVDWLVVDHYALDARWERTLRQTCQRLMVIDDLADRPHDCDLLLDQNLGRTIENYRDLLIPHATALIGPQYALLRPEFAQRRAESLARRAKPQLKQLLITMGGVDKDNATGRVLDALKSCPLPTGLQITVIMGPHAPWLQDIRAQAAKMDYPTQVLVGVSDMAKLMVESDLAIGAAGGTAWERCCLGLPSLILVLAENQQAGAAALQEAGAAIATQTTTELQQRLGNYLSPRDNSTELKSMSIAAAQVTSGKGAFEISEWLMGQHV